MGRHLEIIFDSMLGQIKVRRLEGFRCMKGTIAGLPTAAALARTHNAIAPLMPTG
jgi:hypothetical protein